MAGTATTGRTEHRAGSEVRQLRLNLNKVITDLETLRAVLAASVTLSNEMRDDISAASGASITDLLTELAADHASLILWMTEVDSDIDDLADAVDWLEPDGIYSGDPGVVQGSGDTTKLRCAGTDVRYRIAGKEYVHFTATEVEPPTGEITENLWGAYRIELGTGGVITATRKADPMAYANKEDAILSLGSVARTANTVDAGYCALDAAAGGFTAQTDQPHSGDAQVDTSEYTDVHVPRWKNGLTAAATVAVANGVATLNISAIDANANGVALSQIAAAGTQAMDDADTVTTAKWGGWLLIVDHAGTGTYALAADGVAGTVSAMAYDTQAAVDTALDLVQDRIPAHCVPIARIYLNNVGGGNSWVAGTDNWDHDTAVASATVYPVVHSRVADDTYSIVKPLLAATIAEAVLSTLSEAVPDDLGSAALSTTAVDAAGDLVAATVNA
jgi:hypothetical protein